MTLILVDAQPETIQYLLAMKQYHPDETVASIAGHMLDAQMLYRLKIEEMKAGVREANAQHATAGD